MSSANTADRVLKSSDNQYTIALENAYRKLAEPIGANSVGTPEGLDKTYKNFPKVYNRMLGERRKWRDNLPYSLQSEKGRGSRYLYYQKKIVKLGSEYGANIQFFRLPSIGDSLEILQTQNEAFSKTLRVPINMLPNKYLQLSYHYYRDPTHVSHKFREFYAIWFAEMISQRVTR